MYKANPDLCVDLLDAVRDGICIVDRDRRIQYWNSGAQHIAGYRADIVGRVCGEGTLVHCNEHGEPLCREECPLTLAMETGLVQETDAFLRHAEGHLVPVHLRCSPCHDASGALAGAAQVFHVNPGRWGAEDISERLRRLGQFDEITGVANRRGADANLARCIFEALRARAPFAVLKVDVDHLHDLNLARGEPAVDRALRRIARTLRGGLRELDSVARCAGGEFLVLVAVESPRVARDIAARLCALASSCLGSDGTRVTVSIGGTLYYMSEAAAETLGRADAALYTAKREGGNRVAWV